MKCPTCGQESDPSAAFCGNCGTALKAEPAAAQPVNVAAPGSSPPPATGTGAAHPPDSLAVNPIAANATGPQTAAGAMAPPGMVVGGGTAALPGYSVPKAGDHAAETKVILSIVLGVLGIPGALIPVLGLGLGIAGLVLGVKARNTAKQTLTTVGIVVSCLAVLLSLTAWTYFFNRYTAEHKKTANNSVTTQSTADLRDLSTPCFTAKVSNSLSGYENAAGSCSLKSYNSATAEASSELYTVDASTVTKLTPANFDAASKSALEQTLKEHVPEAVVSSQGADQIAGAQAYVLHATAPNDVNIVFGSVLHETANGNNLFILVHFAQGKGVDFTDLEKYWVWK